MIKVTLELCPGGMDDPKLNEHLGTIFIANDVVKTMQSSGRRGDYNYTIAKKRRAVWREGTIKNFPRLAYHPWNLVKEILDDVAARNGGRI